MNRLRVQAENLASGLCLGLLAQSYASAGPEEMVLLRQGMAGPGGLHFAPNQLKHLDDQTLLALAAVSQAASSPALAQADLSGWGVVAAPRFIGRAALAPQFERFRQEGAWSASPHAVPHRCLHSVSGSISALMKLSGPNFGCGGGPGGDGEAFLAAATVLACEPAPGLWFVLTGHAPEHFAAADGTDSGPWTCHALALALTADVTADCFGQLRILPPLHAARPDGMCCAEELFLLRIRPVLADLCRGHSCQRIFNLGAGLPWLALEPAWAAAPLRRAA